VPSARGAPEDTTRRLSGTVQAGGCTIPDEGIEARSETGPLRPLRGSERDEMIDVLSHELRTPVTVISGLHTLLLSEELGPLTPDQRRSLEEAARSCRWLDRLITDLAGVAEGAPVEVDPSPGSLGSLVEEVVRSQRPLLSDAGLEVEVSFASGADRASFDPMRIEQVMTNLLGNAIRHAPAGSVLRVKARTKGDGRVEVAVRDAGPGVGPEDRERIFRPYARGSGASGGSLGLGLAIARRIVEAHGGTLDYRPDEDGGSQFVFTLPVADRDA
jgi:signal transduction histidine kinase